jgi:hypothetical protein
MIPWGLLGRKGITRPCSTLSHIHAADMSSKAVGVRLLTGVLEFMVLQQLWGTGFMVSETSCSCSCTLPACQFVLPATQVLAFFIMCTPRGPLPLLHVRH